MRSAIMCLFLCLTIGFAHSQSIQQKNFNVKNNLALEGYDPVSYFDGKPVEGKSAYTFTHNGVKYQFVSKTNFDKFKSSPEKYEPAYGGWCAFAMGDSGEKVKVDIETYKIVEGKLYLFYNFWGTNTLTDWNKNERKLKESADRNWGKFVK